MSCKCVCPGTNCVKLFTMAMIGLPICSCFIPAATQRALAPAILLPSVQTALLNLCFIVFFSLFLLLALHETLSERFHDFIPCKKRANRGLKSNQDLPNACIFCAKIVRKSVIHNELFHKLFIIESVCKENR